MASGWTEAQLQAHAQDAVELELFTIPAYLCAYHSIVQSQSKAAESAAEALRTVVNQEMMHLELVCNLCNALGKGPRLTGRAAPRYPGRVPYNRHDVQIALGPATAEQIRRFMTIELPTWRDPYASAPELPPQDAYETIGAFYHSLIHGLGEVYGEGGSPWPAGVNAQVYGNFAEDGSPIADLGSATAALELVIRQGEGASPTDPHDGDPRELAHYYQLQAIIDALAPGDVRNMIENTAGVTWAPRCAALLDFFDAGYSHVLRLLEASFNGQGKVGPPVGMMWAVVNALAAYVVDVPHQAAGADEPSEQTLTPRYRYTTATPAQAYAALGADDVESPAVQDVAKALGLVSG
jgi:hypothetical protein